jgi:hypothetical protein
MLFFAYYCHIQHRIKFETHEMPDAKLSPKSRLHFPGDEWRPLWSPVDAGSFENRIFAVSQFKSAIFVSYEIQLY